MFSQRQSRRGVIEVREPGYHYTSQAFPMGCTGCANSEATGTIRLCGDYRITVNHGYKVDTCPLPKVKDLFAAMSGGKVFTKLQINLQLPLDDKSKELVTINTHKGLFQYNRLPFGVSAAPAIF